MSQTINVPGLAHPIIQSYEYDALNRLALARETNNSVQSWQQVCGYDRYGNRRLKAGTTLPASADIEHDATQNPSINPANNRIDAGQSYGYDNSVSNSAGNLTSAPGYTYQYDGENRLLSFNYAPPNQQATPNRYVYDGAGRRVKKVTGNGQEVTVFVYNAMGQMVVEYNNQPPASESRTSYLTSDTLGTPRVVTKANGEVTARHDYLPFGEEVGVGIDGRTTTQGYGTLYEVRHGYAGYEKDGETGLNYAQARYHSPTQGRFTSPDPLITSSKRGVPQSWNRYAYCLNNPLAFTDPSGLIWGRVTDKDGNQTGAPIWYKDDATMQGAGATAYTQEYYETSGGSWVHLNMRGPTAGADSTFARNGWDFIDAGSVPGSYNPANMPSMQAGPPDNTGAFQMLFEYLIGTGPTDRQFGPNDYMTQGMMTSPDVGIARQKFIDQGGGTYGPTGVRFGLNAEDGPSEAGLNMPRQFVGSFTITITEQRNGDALFILQNTTHLGSLLYQMPGVQPVERSTMAPLSNKTQTYFWTERGIIR